MLKSFYRNNRKTTNDRTIDQIAEIRVFLVLSGLATGLSWILYFRALQFGKASLVAPIDKSSVVLVLVFSAVFLSESLMKQSILSAILIATSTLILNYISDFAALISLLTWGHNIEQLVLVRNKYEV